MTQSASESLNVLETRTILAGTYVYVFGVLVCLAEDVRATAFSETWAHAETQQREYNVSCGGIQAIEH